MNEGTPHFASLLISESARSRHQRVAEEFSRRSQERAYRQARGNDEARKYLWEGGGSMRLEGRRRRRPHRRRRRASDARGPGTKGRRNGSPTRCSERRQQQQQGARPRRSRTALASRRRLFPHVHRCARSSTRPVRWIHGWSRGLSLLVRLIETESRVLFLLD